MNTMTEAARIPVTGRHKMTPSEAFVETLVANGVKDVFGIVGSAYMDALDLFPLAGIRFISVAHEQGAGHMADGYARVSGQPAVCIAQNGPGITNFVTSTAAAFWAHSPVIVRNAGDGQRHAGARRLPGDRADADLLEDHQVPGARQQQGAHGRAHGPRVRPRTPRDGAGAGQHPARLFLRRHRVRDPAAAHDRARRRRRQEPRRGRGAACVRAVSR